MADENYTTYGDHKDDIHLKADVGPLAPDEAARRGLVAVFNDLNDAFTERFSQFILPGGQYHPETVQVHAAEIILLAQLVDDLARELGIDPKKEERNDSNPV